MKIFVEISKMKDLDEVVGIKFIEWYIYVFDMNVQVFDYMYVSFLFVVSSKSDFEYIYVNIWGLYVEMVLDYDFSVVLFDLCG